MIRTLRTALAVLLAAGIAASTLAAAPASAATPKLPTATTSCSGVWVIVDRGNGQATTRCAASGYSDGLKALTKAGFTVKQDSGFVCQVHSYPSKCTTTSFTDYWSYWHATLQADGTWGEWVYSSVGARSWDPSKPVAEGWRFGDGGQFAPSVLPPRAYTAMPTPTVSGPLKVGKTLTADAGTWTPVPTLAYQWYRSGKRIKGATKAAYKLTKSDKKKTLKVRVTARGAGLQTVSKTSAATSKVK